MEYLIYVLAALLGILFCYNHNLTQACKIIGVAISDTDSSTGYQDAITPPNSTNIYLATALAIVVVLGYAVYAFGWGTGGIALAVFFFVSALAGATIMPKPQSIHYLKRIYGSMANRYADFQKEGDSVRAVAIKDLIDKVEVHYSERMK